MPAHRLLSDHQLIAARWEYEVTPISERDLAAKFGISRTAMRKWIARQGWAKANELRCYLGEEGQKQFCRDVRAAIQRAVDRKIILGLERSLVLPPAGKVSRPVEADHPDVAGIAGAWELPADQPKQPTLPPEPMPEQGAGKGNPTGNKRQVAGAMVRFPGPYLPPEGPYEKVTTAFPARSRTEMAAMRVQLSSLRGALALQQMRQLDAHDALLDAYEQMLSLYLNPARFVDVAGLDAAQAAHRLEEASHAAGRVVLPTQRDTLAAAIMALNKARIGSFMAKRAAAGINPRQPLGNAAQRDDDVAAVAPPAALTLNDLRSVQTAMQLLRGAVQRPDEPPRPPPPDELEDLRVRRDDSPAMPDEA
jgi:hypothetical protein